MIIYGIHPVLECLRAGQQPFRILIAREQKTAEFAEILRLAANNKIPVERVSDLGKICGNTVHQGVCANLPDDALIQARGDQPFSGDRVVMLDGVQDPHNFGAALRVCEVFGFRDVIFHKGNSSGITPAVVKVSAGAAFHLNIFESNLNRAAQKLQAAGYSLLVLDGSGDCNVFDLKIPERLCVVVGSEHKGVRFALRRMADAVVRIPTCGQINSLNVSCALTTVLAVCHARNQA